VVLLNTGQRVRIEMGALAGVEGIFVGCKGSSKLVVSVSLLKRSVAVEVDESWVVPVERTHGLPQAGVGSVLKPKLITV